MPSPSSDYVPLIPRYFVTSSANATTAAQDGAAVLSVLHSTFDQILQNTEKIAEDNDSEKIPLKLLQCIEILYDNVLLTEDDQMMVRVFESNPVLKRH